MGSTILELIKKQNVEILKFSPFLDYVSQLQKEGIEFVSYESDSWYQKIIFQNSYYKLEICAIKEDNYEWISFYKYKNDEKYEQIEFMAYTKAYQEFTGTKDHNRIIKYSAHFDDEEFTKMVYAVYSYQDNNFLGGFRNLRKFAVQDLYKVMYSKNMNLTELVGIADKKITKFYEIIDLKVDEVKELKLEY